MDEQHAELEGGLRTRLVVKVIATYVAMAAVAGMSGYQGVRSMRNAEDAMALSLHHHVTPLRDLKLISDLFAMNVVDTVHKTGTGRVSFEEARKTIADARTQSAQLWQGFLDLGTDGEEAAIAHDAEAERQKIDLALIKLEAEVLSRQDRAGLAAFEQNVMYPLIEPFTKRIVKLIEIQVADAGSVAEEVKAESRASANVLLGLAVGSVFAASVFSFLIGLRLAKLKNGAVSLREMTRSLLQSSGEISSGTADLSSRTETQAASLEETASSMEEMAATVKQNAENAQQANRLALSSRETAERGGAVVRSAVGAMEQINSASTKIGEIIDVIDEIAFQTNLLALNAAVEAARAGEQGRGFAVVASEVRTLAKRSATAAQEIKVLIKASVNSVADGSKLVRASGQTLDEIIVAAKKVADIIAEISESSQEQARGIDQVNAAVNQMDKFTQQNAAMAEEVASSSAAMAQRTLEMQTTVAYLSVGGEGSQLIVEEPEREGERPVSRAPVKKVQVRPARAAVEPA